mmetsp:Transcript_82325/g.181066  ORF Transcript_82325/g.181066 Transcript_82325/m.181066 type:complete len:318 (-) Transcript_82325:1140-2093(-)
MCLRQHVQHCEVFVLREGAERELHSQLLCARFWRSIQASHKHQEALFVLEVQLVDDEPKCLDEDGAFCHFLLEDDIEHFPDVDAVLRDCNRAENLPQLCGSDAVCDRAAHATLEAGDDLGHGRWAECGFDLLLDVELARRRWWQAFNFAQSFELALLHAEALPERCVEQIVETAKILQAAAVLPSQEELEEVVWQREAQLAVVRQGEGQDAAEPSITVSKIGVFRVLQLSRIWAEPDLVGSAVKLEEGSACSVELHPSDGAALLVLFKGLVDEERRSSKLARDDSRQLLRLRISESEIDAVSRRCVRQNMGHLRGGL